MGTKGSPFIFLKYLAVDDVMRIFRKDELAKYNGKNGAPAFIAYNGKVYDVSTSFLWKDGDHQVLHKAGKDLGGALGEAPHGDDVFKKFPVVGVMQE
jgi:predicted heme/steroid binding protein